MSELSAPVAAAILFFAQNPLALLGLAVVALVVVAVTCRPTNKRKTVVIDRDHFGRITGRREVE